MPNRPRREIAEPMASCRIELAWTGKPSGARQRRRPDTLPGGRPYRNGAVERRRGREQLRGPAGTSRSSTDCTRCMPSRTSRGPTVPLTRTTPRRLVSGCTGGGTAPTCSRPPGCCDKLLPLDKYRSSLYLLTMIAVPGAGCFPEAALEGALLISLNMRPWKEPTPPTWLRTASSWPILQPKGSAPKRGTLEVRAQASSTYSGKRRPASEPAGSPGTFRVRATLKRVPETEDSPEAALEGPPRMAGLAQRRNALWRTIRFEGTAGPEPR